jgi:hypothetical protein
MSRTASLALPTAFLTFAFRLIHLAFGLQLLVA